MKKTATIVGAALGYIAIQSPFILSPVMREYGFCELMVLVSTLGMLCAFVFGSRPSAKKALLIVCMVIGVPIFVAVLGDFAEFLADRFYVYEEIAVIPVAIGVLAAFIWLLIKLRNRQIRNDAEQWLADRARYRDDPARLKRRNRLERWALWAPSIVVFLMLLFLSQIGGFLTHVSHPLGMQLANYRIRVPISWKLEHGTNYYPYVTASKFHGLGRAAIFWVPKPPSISVIGFVLADKQPYEAEIEWTESIRRNSRSFTNYDLQAGTLKMNCWQAIPANTQKPWPQIRCTADAQSGRILAHFEGVASDIPFFYDSLARTFGPVSPRPFNEPGRQ